MDEATHESFLRKNHVWTSVVQFMLFNKTSSYGFTFSLKFERTIGFGARIFIFLIQSLVQL
jgi:hypothetical protein